MGALRDMLVRVDGAVRKVDAMRYAPNQLAARVMDGLYEERVRLVEADPEWAELKRRRNEAGGGLSWQEAERMFEISEQVAPDPAWAGLARRVEQWRLSDAVRAGRAFVERGGQGWAEVDTWDLGTYLARVAGEALAALADSGQSWPAGEFSSPADWQAALRTQSEALLVWGRGEGGKAEADRWYELDESGEHEQEAQVAWVALAEAEEQARADAQAAMAWVAEHMDTLWD